MSDHVGILSVVPFIFFSIFFFFFADFFFHPKSNLAKIPFLIPSESTTMRLL